MPMCASSSQITPFILNVMTSHPHTESIAQSGLAILHNLIISRPAASDMDRLRLCVHFVLRCLNQFGDAEKVVAPAIVFLRYTAMVRIWPSRLRLMLLFVLKCARSERYLAHYVCPLFS